MPASLDYSLHQKQVVCSSIGVISRVLQTHCYCILPKGKSGQAVTNGGRADQLLSGLIVRAVVFQNPLIFHTPYMASFTMPLLIFEVPALRSLKVIGTSPILKPNFQARYFISIWKA